MTKEVLIGIKGLQMSPEQGSDEVELFVGGEYYFRNNKHYFLYDEVVEGTTETTRNVVKVAPDYMEVTKKGVTNAHMVFEKNKKNVTYYYTPFGSILIGIEAGKVKISEQDEEIQVDVDYALDMNYEKVADCNIHMIVKPKGTKDFTLAN